MILTTQSRSSTDTLRIRLAQWFNIFHLVRECFLWGRAGSPMMGVLTHAVLTGSRPMKGTMLLLPLPGFAFLPLSPPCIFHSCISLMEEGGCSRSLGWDKDLKKCWQGWGPAGVGQETARVGSPAGTVGLDSSGCEWQPTPVLVPGESHGQRSLGSQRVGHDWLNLAPGRAPEACCRFLEQPWWQQSGVLFSAVAAALQSSVSSSGLSFYVPGALLGAFTLVLGR